MKAVNIYEVVRVINSAPLFLNEHHERFENSLKSLNVKTVYEQNFHQEICSAIKSLGIDNGNLRIDTIVSENTSKCVISVKQINHRYPEPEQYKHGIKTCLYEHERPNPKKKIWHGKIRQKIDKIISATDYYEVLFYDENCILTEGSRSNLFFILENKLFTPKSENVLPGITRLKIFELAMQIGIKITEKDISISEIKNFDVAFISGTSPKILPVNTIENVSYNVENKLMRKLMLGFDKLIQQDIDGFKTCN
ncbi:MAG: aminotransferase class IV [Bacteroidales bacterium]|nr:aminotransferase class IV [Bacteroidales bacterium]